MSADLGRLDMVSMSADARRVLQESIAGDQNVSLLNNQRVAVRRMRGARMVAEEPRQHLVSMNAEVQMMLF